MGKAKGSVVLHAVKALRKQREAALFVLPASLHHYLEERIVVASWYPEEDLWALVESLVTVIGGPRDQVIDFIGATLARSHSEGLYADLRHRTTAIRTHTGWRTQHDTGLLTIIAETPTSITYELAGWDHASPLCCRAIGSYLAEGHRMAGDRNPNAAHTTCRTQRADRCVWIVSRDPAD